MPDSVATITPELREAYREHERSQRIHTGKLACALVFFLMPAGVFLDFFVYREEVFHFLGVRIGCSVLAAILYYFHTLPIGRKNIEYLGIPIALLPALSIAWMIHATEGPQSPYYAGLNLVLLAISAVVHWTIIESLLAVFLVLVAYLVACITKVGWDLPTGIFVNNIYFLVLTGIIVVAGNVLIDRLRFKQFVLAFELEKNKKELEASNQKLTELDQIKGRFFANISHELRTPLTLMISPLETIMARYRNTLEPDTVNLLQTMHSNGLRLLKLINDLLDLVRLDSGVMQVRREAVGFENFLRGMASAAKQIADDKRIQLIVDIDPQINAVMVDRDKFEKIVLNLQFNALKFTPSGGRVELRASKEGEELVLRVIDTGIGIPAKDLPAMFSRFFQVDSSSRRKFQGVGIGLALVKELVELHGGTVSVQSVEGEGTTFVVRMPYIQGDPNAVTERPVEPAPSSAPASAQPAGEQPSAPTVSSQEWLSNLYHRANLFGGVAGERSGPVIVDNTNANSSNGRKFTAVVADDQPDMLRFIQSELAQHYRVIAVSDGQQAVDQALAVSPDIVLLDMMMPEKDGLQACREIRAAPKTQNVPIILITAHVDEETKINALRAGASDFLPKPFSTTELHVRVRNLVESFDFQRKLAGQNQALEATIDQLKNTETQLVQSEKLASLGRLSAGIIHEINNPLNFAATALFTLRGKARFIPEGERNDYAEILRDVEEGVQRVKSIVSDLRTFTHPGTTGTEPVDVADVVSSALRFLSSEWKSKVDIQMNLLDGQTVLGDKNKLIQVMVNLLQNSLDALKGKQFPPDERPSILVTGREERGSTLVVVRDNGEGIKPDVMDKIFDPFFTTKDVGEGMGLGLSICYRIVQDFGGRINVRSEPGRFCEFTLEFPLKEAQSILQP